MKLEEGMYVRIQWGNEEQTISKCNIKIDIGDTQYSNNDFYIHTDKKGEVIYKNMIVKASYNIIDLIEVGDYVNGDKVLFKDTGIAHNQKLVVCLGNDEERHIYDEVCIKSIVTKEMFEKMKYEVK